MLNFSTTALFLASQVLATKVPLASSLAQSEAEAERGWGGFSKYCSPPPEPRTIDLIANLRWDSILPSSNEDDDTTAPDERNIIIGSQSNGELGSTAGAWVAGVDAEDEFLQVQLKRTEWITGVVTQGQSDGSGALIRHVSKYCVLIHDIEGWKTTNDEGESWEAYDGTTCSEFDGTGVADTSVVEFDTPVAARIVKILVKDWVDTTGDGLPGTQLGLLSQAKPSKSGYSGSCYKPNSCGCYSKNCPKCYTPPKVCKRCDDKNPAFEW